MISIYTRSCWETQAQYYISAELRISSRRWLAGFLKLAKRLAAILGRTEGTEGALKGHPHKVYRRRTEGFSDGSQVCMPVRYKKGVKDGPP